jgi:hypothetical protein
MTDQPVWTCADCGIEHGNGEPQFATWHMGTCGVCGCRRAVTEPRDYGYLRPSWRVNVGTGRPPVGATTKDVGQSTTEPNPFPGLLYDLIDEARHVS